MRFPEPPDAVTVAERVAHRCPEHEPGILDEMMRVDLDVTGARRA